MMTTIATMTALPATMTTLPAAQTGAPTQHPTPTPRPRTRAMMTAIATISTLAQTDVQTDAPIQHPAPTPIPTIPTLPAALTDAPTQHPTPTPRPRTRVFMTTMATISMLAQTDAPTDAPTQHPTPTPIFTIPTIPTLPAAQTDAQTDAPTQHPTPTPIFAIPKIPTLPAAQTDAPTDVPTQHPTPTPRPRTRAMMTTSRRHLSTRSLHQHGKDCLVAESANYEKWPMKNLSRRRLQIGARRSGSLRLRTQRRENLPEHHCPLLPTPPLLLADPSRVRVVVVAVGGCLFSHFSLSLTEPWSWQFFFNGTAPCLVSSADEPPRIVLRFESI